MTKQNLNCIPPYIAQNANAFSSDNYEHSNNDIRNLY